MFSDYSLTGFLDDLSSRKPMPGGGGASAVAGAMAASLGAMVANLTSGKKRYAEVQDQIDEILPEAERLRDRMLELAQEDADAFYPLSQAYGLPKETEGERAYKAEGREQALRRASEPPLHIMECTCEVMDLLETLSTIGSRMVISDVGVGAAFCEAALKGASFNVFINAKAMKDRDYAEILVSRTQAMLEDGCAKADEAYLRVERGIRWQRS